MAANLQRPLGERRLGDTPKTRAPVRGLVVKLGAVTAIVLLLALVLSRIDLHHDLSRMRLSVLSGEPEGNYHLIVTQMAALAAARNGNVREVPSAGSVDNVARLLAAAKTCEVQFGLAQDGSNWTGAASATAGATTPLALYGRLAKPESVLFLGKTADRLKDFAELRGLRIGIGPAGSGTERVARQLFGLPDFASLGVTLSTESWGDQLDKLASGALDLGVFVMEADAPLIASAVTDRGLELAGFAHVSGVARRLPHLRAGHVDAGAYDAVRVLPPTDKEVLRIETLLVGNGCAGRTQTMDLLSVLSRQYPDFVRHNKDTENTSTLATAEVAEEFYDNGGPQVADLYVPWLVDFMPPANWAYVVMGVSLLFNAMGAGHRYRLWRIDAARVKLEEHLVDIFGKTVTLGDIQHMPLEPKAKYLEPKAQDGVRALIEELEDLAARSRRYSLSMLVPMGQEMAYRYQEGVIYETLAVLRDFRKRAAAATTAKAT